MGVAAEEGGASRRLAQAPRTHLLHRAGVSQVGRRRRDGVPALLEGADGARPTIPRTLEATTQLRALLAGEQRLSPLPPLRPLYLQRVTGAPRILHQSGVRRRSLARWNGAHRRPYRPRQVLGESPTQEDINHPIRRRRTQKLSSGAICQKEGTTVRRVQAVLHHNGIRVHLARR